MIFSSITFLLLFLPMTLLAYYGAGRRFRNLVLLFASLFFYAWGEGAYMFLMVASIGLNYLVGVFLERAATRKGRRNYLIVGIVANLVLLSFFKYTNWLVGMVTAVLPGVSSTDIFLEPVHLPIGISFFTFQALSYVIDVYRNETPSQRNPFHLGLYIASFPQLIAGPIVRYNQVAEQIISRNHSFSLFASGVERFIFGLGKKVIIANSMGEMADLIFIQEYTHLPAGVAWLGIICYTLQIYFDFSGYSDMAIGLGRMFGFHFPENFNYPYISRSIQEFWRRWHISLSGWFRDYLYIPLGGNRKGTARTYRNLLIVFLLCGLWHGASWNFVIWGLIHGAFLALERTVLKNWLSTCPRAFGHCYTLLIVVHAWVFFRVEDLSQVIDYLKAMYGLSNRSDHLISAVLLLEIDRLFVFILAMGLVLSTPVYARVENILKVFVEKRCVGTRAFSILAAMGRPLVLFFLFYLSLSFLAVHAYNPFIYFRF